ncbi:MAG: hypothetical protein PHD13_05495 [Methanocellales archaeon]|nr:hypothetical protein [Methanocellales archaeon]MDD3292350.1 hypothetical protein [Methanocellales archaeon]MDD5235608.1 hypothetical protein [Methanocellales archaeon]MDD5485745.1 hypothetical protein [Methanocellales archaeon]
MPYLFTVEVRYENGKYILHNPADLMSNFPFLEGKIMTGKFTSIYRDGRTIRVNKEFKCKLIRSDNTNTVIGEVLEPNPLKTIGLPMPSTLLFTACKYKEEKDRARREFPIAENVMLKGSTYTFEDEVKRILKEEEAGLILEGTIFYPQLEKQVSTLKDALSLFEQEEYASTKTSCRKILEYIKQISSKWKTVDGSESLCDKLKSVIVSQYSFASIGGPHEGVTTKEETELILKNVTSLLLYINSLLKNQRVLKKQSAT